MSFEDLASRTGTLRKQQSPLPPAPYVLETPQQPVVSVDWTVKPYLAFCSNDYLGPG